VAFTSLEGLDVRDGSVDTREQARSAAAADFGHVASSVPSAVVRPGSVADVVGVMRWAAGHGVRVAARGSGHSMNGQSQVEAGLVVDMSSLSRVRSVHRDRVVVDGGARWSTVLSATLPVGLAPPALPDYLELTVGGTVSVGGVGGMAFRHGAVTDNVVELDVVTGDGRLLTCSPTQHADLFDLVRAGLGQYGLIVGATLRLVGAHETVRCYRLGYDDVATFTDDERLLIDDGATAYLEGYAKFKAGQPRYEVELATYDSTFAQDKTLLDRLHHRRDLMEVEEFGYGEFLNRLAPGVAARIEAGEWEWPHPWLNVFLPSTAVGDILGRVMAELTAADLDNFGLILVYPIPAGSLRTPLLRKPDGPAVFLLALLLTADTADPLAVDRILARNARLYELCRSAGGFLYPVGHPALTPAEWQAHFGTSWADVTAGKAAWDSARILTPGAGIGLGVE
jgi:cytokinin dehydrogenase